MAVMDHIATRFANGGGEHVVDAPCKVNWFLEIERKREDGYHEITTEMETIDWCDRIGAVRRDDGVLDLQVTGNPALVAAVGSARDNLVLRAAHVLRDDLVASGVTMAVPGANLWLEKRVPAGAGLGGGSSDSVATMRLLCRVWNVELPEVRLAALAAMLGSDTAFFVRGGRAVCRGRGELVTPLTPSDRKHLVVVWPGFPLSTPLVYRSGHIDLTSPRRVWSEAATNTMFNRLEAACVKLEPRVGHAIHLARQVAEHATAPSHEPPHVMLSGSGSALIVTATDADHAATMAATLTKAFHAPAMVRACYTLA